jgi:hypothetical protein
MVIKYNNIFHSKALRILPKFENKPSGNPASNSTRDKQRIAGRVEKKTRLKFFTYVQIVRKKMEIPEEIYFKGSRLHKPSYSKDECLHFGSNLRLFLYILSNFVS